MASIKLPLKLQTGSTVRNMLVGLGYVIAVGVVLILSVVLLPLITAVGVGTNYRGSADRFARR